MSVAEVKKRVVNFRLTEEEYQVLRNASTATGARTISDFARSVLLLKSGHPSPENTAQTTLSHLELRLSELENKLSTLCAALHLNGSDVFGSREQ